MPQTSKGVFKLLFILIALYALATFAIPPGPETVGRYNISILQLRLLQATVVIPVALIWFAAAFGYVRFKEYAESIRKTAEGKAFSHIVRGIGILALGLPLSSFASLTTNQWVRERPDLVRWSVLFNHYLAILIVLFAFVAIYKGSLILRQVTKVGPRVKEQALLLGGFGVFSFTYIYLLLSNPVRGAEDPQVIGQTIFFLPEWMLALTVVLPYLYVWYIGLQACLHIHTYQKHVKGIIYRQSLYYLALGIGAVVAGSISRQYVVAVSNLLIDLRLAPLLILVYSLLIIIAAGYILIVFGAHKLKRIEEV